MKNKGIIAFLIGLLIPTIIAPILEEVADLAVNRLEIIKGGQIKKITEINIENTKLASKLEDEDTDTYTATNAIGFEIPSVDEEEEYCEEDV